MPCSCDRRGMWDRRENVIVSLVVKWLGNMMNEVDIENLTIEQYLMLTHGSQTQGMVRTEFGSTNLGENEWLNVEMSKRMIGQDKEEEEDTLIDILKTVVEESKEKEGKSSKTLPCKQQSNEINPGGFTLPCTISNLKIYDMADVEEGINMMPKSLFKHLKLASLKETSMVVEMADMTKKAPLGIVENILVKLDKFLFPSDFVVIDMLGEPNETMLLV
ncbi:ribonuclease H-like domain, reverse transcriptase, RNA-dependent DNA polymerase, partial [Tanacetum coccineum]